MSRERFKSFITHKALGDQTVIVSVDKVRINIRTFRTLCVGIQG